MEEEAKKKRARNIRKALNFTIFFFCLQEEEESKEYQEGPELHFFFVCFHVICFQVLYIKRGEC